MTHCDGAWYYQMIELGYNYRMTDMQAALGLSQLKRIDKFIKRRREIVDLYKKLFAGDERFSFLQEQEYSKSAWHLWPLLINFDEALNGLEINVSRPTSHLKCFDGQAEIPPKPLATANKIKINKKDLFEKLKQAGLYLQVHYIPVHTQPYFQKLGFKVGNYPNAENYYQQTLSLPLHPGLSDSDVRKIVEVVKDLCV
jgi:dTDP-4-amino-4,6-dideoxygalactose transaminase